MIGTLVWARSPAADGVWWPGEVLDPWYMPLTRCLPPGATIGKILNLCCLPIAAPNCFSQKCFQGSSFVAGLHKSVYKASIPTGNHEILQATDWLARLYSKQTGGTTVPTESEAMPFTVPLRSMQNQLSLRKVVITFYLLARILCCMQSLVNIIELCCSTPGAGRLLWRRLQCLAEP